MGQVLKKKKVRLQKLQLFAYSKILCKAKESSSKGLKGKGREKFLSILFVHLY